MNRINKSIQTAQRTVNFIIKANPEEFYDFTFDLWFFHLYVSTGQSFFPIDFRNGHPVLGDICIKRPKYFHDKLVNTLRNELNHTHSLTEVFKIVLCLEYIGIKLDSVYAEDENNFIITCVKDLIKLMTHENDWFLPYSSFIKLYKALEMLGR